MDDSASSTGRFYQGNPSAGNYYHVVVDTHPWERGFVTDVYERHFIHNKEVPSDRRHFEIRSETAHAAHSAHLESLAQEKQ